MKKQSKKEKRNSQLDKIVNSLTKEHIKYFETLSENSGDSFTDKIYCEMPDVYDQLPEVSELPEEIAAGIQTHYERFFDFKVDEMETVFDASENLYILLKTLFNEPLTTEELFVWGLGEEELTKEEINKKIKERIKEEIDKLIPKD